MRRVRRDTLCFRLDTEVHSSLPPSNQYARVLPRMASPLLQWNLPTFRVVNDEGEFSFSTRALRPSGRIDRFGWVGSELWRIHAEVRPAFALTSTWTLLEAALRREWLIV